MTQSNRAPTDIELDGCRTLAAAIIAASPAMPDPNAHLLWLLSLPERQLRKRLETIRREGCICRAGNYQPRRRVLVPAQPQPQAA
jgi:hypothetical protein